MGNEKNVRILQDNWLPRDSYFRVLSPPSEYWDVEATVDKLFVAGLRQWHVGLLHELFSQEEVEQILSLPLSLQTVIDRRIWHYERNGNFFFVQSAYHVAWAIESSQRGWRKYLCLSA